MSNFIVSARKYRPALFKEVKGNSHISATLQNAIKNQQLAQAILLCGPKGTGKTSTARILAKSVNCTAITAAGEPCNECKNCVAFNNQTSFNTHELDAASHNSAEDMRQIVDQLHYHPSVGKKMVVIIDEAHMLSNAALNVLLKPMEDTPSHVLFILVTTEKHKIIPTIRSRCQVFDFHPIEATDIAAQLHYIAAREQIICEGEAIELISATSDGSLRDALSVFDLVVTFSGTKKLSYPDALYHLHLLEDTHYFALTDALYQGRSGEGLVQYDQILSRGFDSSHLINGLSEHLRNLFVAKNATTTHLLKKNAQQREAYIAKAKEYTPYFISQALALVQQCQLHYKNVPNQRLHVELALIMIAQINTKTAAAPIAAPPPLPAKPQKEQQPVQPAPPLQKAPQPVAAPVATPAPEPTVAAEPKPAATPTPNTKEEAKPSKLTGIKTPSLAKLKKAMPAQEASVTPRPATPPRPITHPDAVRQLIQDYAQQRQQQGDMAGYTLLQQPIQITEHRVIITLSNPLQQPKFNTFRADLLAQLRAALDHPTIVLEDVVITPQGPKPPATDYEKLQAMITGYPAVRTLQEKLALD